MVITRHTLKVVECDIVFSCFVFFGRAKNQDSPYVGPALR